MKIPKNIRVLLGMAPRDPRVCLALGTVASVKESNCGDQYFEENKQIFNFLLCTIILEFPDRVPMGNIFLKSFHL